MSELKPRKKLSLGRKTLTTNSKLKTSRTINSNLRDKLKAKKEKSVNNFLENTDNNLTKLYEDRKSIVNQIKQVEQRLQFATSQPLQEYLIELKKDDFKCLAMINNYIINL